MPAQRLRSAPRDGALWDFVITVLYIYVLYTFFFHFSVFLFCFFVFCFHEALCDGMECCGVLNFVCAFVWIRACRSVMESCEFRLGRFRSAVLDLASLIRAA